MRLFLARLVGKDEAAVDSIIVGGFGVLGVLSIGPLYDLVVNHVSFNPMQLGAGGAAVLAAMAGGKGYRDRCTGGGDVPDTGPK